MPLKDMGMDRMGTPVWQDMDVNWLVELPTVLNQIKGGKFISFVEKQDLDGKEESDQKRSWKQIQKEMKYLWDGFDWRTRRLPTFSSTTSKDGDMADPPRLASPKSSHKSRAYRTRLVTMALYL
jgi:hypothetical protein